MIDSKEAMKLVIEKYNPEGYPLGIPKWNEDEQMWFIPILSKDGPKVINTIGIDQEGRSSQV